MSNDPANTSFSVYIRCYSIYKFLGPAASNLSSVQKSSVSVCFVRTTEQINTEDAMQYRNSGTSEEHVIQNRFTTYLLVALRRRKSAVLSHRDSHQQHEQPIESSDNVFASAYDMEDAVCRALDLQTEYAALMRLLEKLQERDRLIFLSRALKERSFAELADEFHIGYKGVAAIYYRTIQRIKKELEER